MKTTETLSPNPNTTANYVREFFLQHLPPTPFIIPKQTTPQSTSPGCQATLLTSPPLKHYYSSRASLPTVPSPPPPPPVPGGTSPHREHITPSLPPLPLLHLFSLHIMPFATPRTHQQATLTHTFLSPKTDSFGPILQTVK